MMLLSLTAWLPTIGEVELIFTPSLPEAQAKLDGGEQDFNGNASFSFGGAVLLPFANRIRGTPGPQRTLEAQIGGASRTLPRNWGGHADGAEQYAMHGLILAAPFEIDRQTPNRVDASLNAGDFGGAWPSQIKTRISYDLSPRALTLRVTAENVGEEATPVGIGWHPYFNLHGDRQAVRLALPAASRLEVDNYDQVLPTGRITPVQNTAQDFRGGAPLGDLYLDDCFIDLDRPDGVLAIEIQDERCKLRLTTRAEHVQAVQVFAPPDRAILVVEPQFNRPDPFAPFWNGDGGMVRLEVGETVNYDVEVALVPLPSPHT